MVRLWEHMRARVTKGEGRGIEPEGEEPPPLVGESEVLYRTVLQNIVDITWGGGGRLENGVSRPGFCK